MSNKNSILTITYRFIRVVLWLVKVIWVVVICYPNWSREKQHDKSILLVKKLNQILHMKVEIHGDPKSLQAPLLIVANHISWIDVMGMLSITSMSFISRKETENWPVLGRLLKGIECIFINREQRKDIPIINRMIVSYLQEGRNVAFFPEAGTSKDGITLLPFKAALFQSAIDAKVPIAPLHIRYFDQDGKMTTRVAYTEHMNFMSNLFNILKLPEFTLRLDILPLQMPESYLNYETHFMLKDKVEKMIQAADIELIDKVK